MSTLPHHRWLALAGIAIASFLGCLDFTIVNTAIPALQAHFAASVGQVQWAVSVFVMALSTFMVAAGRLADLHGRRKALYLAMLVFALASLGAGLAPQLQVLVGWRFFQGLACAVLYTTSATLVGQAFPPQQRGRALGLLFAANGLGLALGPVLGGWLVASLGWRWVFLLNVPLTALAFALCRGHVAESRGTAGGRLDVAGLLVWMLALPCLLLAITHGGQWGWGAWPTLTLLLAALALLALFITIERHAVQPLLRLGLFSNPQFVAAASANALLAFFYCAAFLLMPLYLGLVRQQGSAASGWLLLPVTAVMGAVSPLAGRWADRNGPQRVMLMGFAALALSAALQAGFSAHSAWWQVLGAFACMGFGWGCILGPSTMAALASVPEQDGAMAMGACWTLHNLGGALGLAVVTVVAQRGGTFLTGFGAAMGWLLGACGLALLVVGLLGRRVETVLTERH